MNEGAKRLNLEQKRNLYRDGYIVLKKVIPVDLIEEAKKKRGK